MGRPQFNIDATYLRTLRERKGLTQAEVAEQIGRHEVTYQNYESSGKTSKQTAKKLAEFFDVSVEKLQQGIEYPDPADYLRQIEKSVRDALARGGNAALEQARQQTLKNTRFSSGTQDENRDDAIRYLAQDIAVRIEAVQLVRNKKEIAELVKLTGLPEAELLRPANVEGHWFINVFESWQTDPNAPAEEFNSHTELTQRADWAIGSIKESIEKSLKFRSCSDESIHLKQDNFWYQIEVKHPWSRQKIRIDLVRCQPDAKGLRWVKPSRRDEYLIREPLIRWAKENFNFICDFEGKQHPSKLEQLCFVVTEHNAFSFNEPIRQTIIHGEFDEFFEQCCNNRTQEGQLHDFFLSNLGNRLREFLTHKLSSNSSGWESSAWASSILLTNRKLRDRITHHQDRTVIARLKSRQAPTDDLYIADPELSKETVEYHIRLVEQVSPGQCNTAPWQQKDCEAFKERLDGWIRDMQTVVPDMPTDVN